MHGAISHENLQRSHGLSLSVKYFGFSFALPSTSCHFVLKQSKTSRINEIDKEITTALFSIYNLTAFSAHLNICFKYLHASFHFTLTLQQRI